MDVEWAVHMLERFGLPGIFVVIALEYACFPMPSEVLLPIGGLAVAASGAPLALGVAVSVAAGLLGSSVCYCVGAWCGRPFIERLLRRFPKALSALEKTECWQNQTGGLSVMVARVIPVFRTWVSFAAGFARQPFHSFALYSVIGIIVWNTILLGSGYYLYTSGVAYAIADTLWILPAVGFAVAIVAALLRGRRK